MGKGRVESIKAWLASVLGQRGHLPAATTPVEEPSVSTLLEIDHSYRKQADADKLPKIAPQRFNPSGEAWLPILHTTRGEWHFTALYSNTQRAHELGRCRDWVVIYFYNGLHPEGQCTIVTETRGDLVGRRVVRGREYECRDHYSSRQRKTAS